MEPTYWKNGTKNTFSGSGFNDGYLIHGCSKGTDVYLLGSLQTGAGVDQAYYWKNGTATKVTTTGGRSRGNAIYVQ